MHNYAFSYALPESPTAGSPKAEQGTDMWPTERKALPALLIALVLRLVCAG